jgi:hypothetical protein
LYEPNKIGGRLSVINVGGRDYEVGGSIIHPQNKYMMDFLKLLGNLGLLTVKLYVFNYILLWMHTFSVCPIGTT